MSYLFQIIQFIIDFDVIANKIPEKLKNIHATKKYGYLGFEKDDFSKQMLTKLEKDLMENGISKENIFIDIESDFAQNKPKFNHLIETLLQKNDVLIIPQIDQCSKTSYTFLKLHEKLFRKSIQLLILEMPHSDDLAVNKLIAENFVALAEFETKNRKKIQMKGIAAAKEAGKYKGRKTVITERLINQVLELKERFSIKEIAKMIGISQNTIYKILRISN